jgi:group I intron endonuclease
MIVYIAINKINGKQYIGQHSGNDLKKYWIKKSSAAKTKPKPNQAFFSAILKYGAKNFEIKPLVIVGTKQELDYYERGLIKAFNTKAPNGYNLTDGGEGTHGWSPNPEMRSRISKALIGRHKPNKLKGIPRSEETKRKISESRLGKALSDSHVVALKIGSHNRWHIKRNIKNPECELCKGV